jgi:hypothetical protein
MVGNIGARAEWGVGGGGTVVTVSSPVVFMSGVPSGHLLGQARRALGGPGGFWWCPPGPSLVKNAPTNSAESRRGTVEGGAARGPPRPGRESDSTSSRKRGFRSHNRTLIRAPVTRPGVCDTEAVTNGVVTLPPIQRGVDHDRKAGLREWHCLLAGTFLNHSGSPPVHCPRQKCGGWNAGAGGTHVSCQPSKKKAPPKRGSGVPHCSTAGSPLRLRNAG